MLDWINVTPTLLHETLEDTAGRDCPQKRISSPLLWKMVVDNINLLINITGMGTNNLDYADNISAILVVRQFIESVLEIMNQRLQEVNA